METTNLLFALLRHAVCGEKLNEKAIRSCTPENLDSVYVLAKKHDLAHLVAHSVQSLKIPDCDVLDKLKKAKMTAIYRYAQLDFEFSRICNIFEESKIPFIPLKGSVLRQYYPEPWMRTSCDIDILVKEENLDSAADALVGCGWKEKKKRAPDHDRSFYSATNVHLELHYSLAENKDNIDPILAQVWAHCVPADDLQYECCQSHDFFLFHHIAHMSHHFLTGGCGIRSFMDLWVLKKAGYGNTSGFRRLCEQAQLDTFASCAMDLAEVWFEGREPSILMCRMEQYVLLGGTYGSLSNKVLIDQTNTRSRTANLMERIWQPFDLLSMYYPILKIHRWLSPFFQIVRWFRIILSGRLKRSLSEMQAASRISDEQLAGAQEILEEIGLSGITRSSLRNSNL